VEACPADALEIKGAEVAAWEIVEHAVRISPFLRRSGGGVTLTGGEPTLQADFSYAILALCRENGIHTAVETCGYAPWEKLEKLASVTDLFLYDLKHPDEEEHRRLTGASNRRVLENLRRLTRLRVGIVVRVPLIPGCNDSPEVVRAIGRTAFELGVDRMSLLPFNPAPAGKYSWFHRAYPLGSVKRQSDGYVAQLEEMLRKEGAMMMIASTKVHDQEELKKMLSKAPRIEEVNYIEQVSTKESYIHQEGRYNAQRFEYEKSETSKKIIALDFGIKRNILNELTHAGMEVEVVPNSIKADVIIEKFKSGKIDGVFLSNGPGDPLILKEEQEKIKELIAAKVPLFGICLGHQLLSIAHGYDTFKLKFGHHGGNHPVKNKINGMVEITAQNHNYNVPDNITEVATVTHTNLFDNTIEGLRYNDSPIISVQHHPEASPGPHESSYIFSEFRNML